MTTLGVSKKINSDLIKERKKCTFNTVELTYLLDGGEDKTVERRSRGNYIRLNEGIVRYIFSNFFRKFFLARS